jgi:deazaflavin-dependent oxidoreductase (nitroreductase family)
VSKFLRVADKVAATRPGAWLVINVLNPVDRLVMRRTKGGGASAGKGHPKLLLHHVGAKTGLARETPLMCIPGDDHWLIVASKGGDPHHPAWYWNVRADPDVTIDCDGETIAVRARELDGEEHRAAWQRALTEYGGFATYQARAGHRIIPILRLEPRDG